MGPRQYIFLGAPGSGKGTQATKLTKERSLEHLSTGDLLRAEIGKNSDLGQRVKSVIDQGNLVSDDLVLELLKANCDIGKKSYIFDGFPRNFEQAKLLESEVLKGADSQAIYFEIDLELLVERVVNRRIAPRSGEIYNLKTRPPKVEGKCDITGEDLIQRKDDTEETVRNRMNVFQETIRPVLDFYREKGALKTVDASGSESEIFTSLLGIVNSK